MGNPSSSIDDLGIVGGIRIMSVSPLIKARSNSVRLIVMAGHNQAKDSKSPAIWGDETCTANSSFRQIGECEIPQPRQGRGQTTLKSKCVTIERHEECSNLRPFLEVEKAGCVVSLKALMKWKETSQLLYQ